MQLQQTTNESKNKVKNANENASKPQAVSYVTRQASNVPSMQIEGLPTA